MPDILIRGMEMPSGAELLCVNIHPNGDVTINLDLKCTPIAHAVELPPHGDLIDRDAIKYVTLYGAVLGTTEPIINEQPVVVPAERRDADA